jgi:hypothetical protein
VLCVQAIHGCNHCTCAKQFKHLIPQDYDLAADPKMRAILGVPRTKAGTVAAMAQFELDLAAEMLTNKERYVEECGGGVEGLAAYNLWAGVPGLGHVTNHPCHSTVTAPPPRQYKLPLPLVPVPLPLVGSYENTGDIAWFPPRPPV